MVMVVGRGYLWVHVVKGRVVRKEWVRVFKSTQKLRLVMRMHQRTGTPVERMHSQRIWRHLAEWNLG